MKKRPYAVVGTSVDLSLKANDVRLWLCIVRHEGEKWNLHTAINTALIELGHRAGYNPDWQEDPRNQEKIQEWLLHHRGKHVREFFPGLMPVEGHEKDTTHHGDEYTDEERTMEEVVYA